MIPQDFSVEEFAQSIVNQAQEAFPPEIPEEIKKTITNIIYEYIKIAGYALAQEEHLYNQNEAIIICQLVSEWVYHKGIDNYEIQIPQEYCEPILQQIAFAIFETTKKGVVQGKTQDEIVDLAENTVNGTYRALIQQLADENILEKPIEEILNQFNLKKYIKQINNEILLDKKDVDNYICIKKISKYGIFNNKWFLGICYFIYLIIIICLVFLLTYFKIFNNNGFWALIFGFVCGFVSIIIDSFMMENKKLYIDVNKSGDLCTFIIENNKKTYIDIWKKENIKSFTDKLLSSGKIIVHLNDNKNSKNYIESYDVRVKALLLNHYPDKVPEKWILNSDVKKYMQRNKVSISKLEILIIVLSLINSIAYVIFIVWMIIFCWKNGFLLQSIGCIYMHYYKA